MKAQDLINKANYGIVGIDENLNVFGGYDNTFDQAGASSECPEWYEPEGWDEMPKEENAHWPTG